MPWVRKGGGIYRCFHCQQKGTEGINVSRPGDHWLAEPLIKRQGELEGRCGAQRKAMIAASRR